MTFGKMRAYENAGMRIMDTSPTRRFAYWSVRLLDISPTTWTVCMQIAHFANKTTRIKSNVASATNLRQKHVCEQLA